MILGIDEVGRGAWAGPLVVGAVVLGGAEIDGLTDSKLLTKKRRESLNDEIVQSASGIGLGWVWPEEIDQLGLGPSLHLAAKRAVRDVDCSFHEIIVDGTVNLLAGTPLEAYVATMKKADLLIPCVSAASIVAKVARDRYMAGKDDRYPDFHFSSHVGYGTSAHREAIERHGVTPLHRLSIAPLQQYSSKSGGGVPVASVDGPYTRTSRQIGDASESIAAMALRERGHKIIERNWKTKLCEIDIVSMMGDRVYFTEVKHRRKDTAGDGVAAITNKKLDRMKRAAELYILKNKLEAYDRQLMAIATSGEPPVVGEILEIL